MQLKTLSMLALIAAASSCGGAGGARSTTGSDLPPPSADGDDESDSYDGDDVASDGDDEDDEPADGASDESSDVSDGEDDACQEYTVRAKQNSPEMLIVFDRSSSMVIFGTDRWTPAVTGTEKVTGELDWAIKFGLMQFPDNGGCSAADVNVPVALKNAPDIKSFLDVTLPTGTTTPTPQALATAHAALGSGIAGPDEVSVGKYVILVTDGAPTCTLVLDQSMVDQSVQEIGAMADDGIKTYVLGYQVTGAEATALDSMAAAGDTGLTSHINIADQAKLEAELKKIAGAAVSCEFQLEAPADDPSFVNVKIDEVAQKLGGTDGWVISEDKQTVTLQGDACAKLKDGEKHTLSVKVECEPVIVR